jgi:hypothetical protein
MTSDQDSWLYAALAPARSLEPTDAELTPVAAAVAARRRRRPSRGRRMLAIALPAALLAATAAAATGLIPVGSVISGEGFDGDERPAVEETVVASGAQKDIGEWRMTTFETSEGVPCLKLTLLDPAAGRAPGPAASGYCGGIDDFSEFGHGRRAAAVTRGEVLLFGSVPVAARTVELTGDDGEKVSAAVHSGTGGDRGYWALAAPARLDGASVAWVDARGVRRDELDIAHRFGGPSAPTVVASGSTPVAGPWRMIAYESERGVAKGDVYEPEGLPCMKVRLLDPPAGTASASGSCGVMPKYPGFTRGQTRVPATVGTPPRELIMYGRAPAKADAVEVAAGGKTTATDTIPAPRGIPGRFWLLAGPPEDFANGRVYWVDHDGGARGRPVEVLPP